MSKKLNLIARLAQVIAKNAGNPKKELLFLDIPKKTLKVSVATSEGEVGLEIYFPKNINQSVKAPVYVNYHGGGFILRNPESDDHICRYIANKADCFVVNVDYDVGPQKPFPVAPIQSYEVVQWVISNGEKYGWSSSNFAIGGQSAGGNLAAGICISALRNKTPLPKLQVLFYPPLELSMPPEDKNSTIDKPVITPRISNIFNEAYFLTLDDRKDPLASPLLAKSFSGLPKTLVITAAHDLLCDEGKAYAEQLSKAGVEVEYHMIENVDHGFTHFGPIDEAKASIDLVAISLRKAFYS